jgi:predicted transcriptional regulator
MAPLVVTKKLRTKAVLRELTDRPGLSVKQLADSLQVDRHFMAGYLLALEESRKVSSRTVGPARIYFKLGSG